MSPRLVLLQTGLSVLCSMYRMKMNPSKNTILSRLAADKEFFSNFFPLLLIQQKLSGECLLLGVEGPFLGKESTRE